MTGSDTQSDAGSDAGSEGAYPGVELRERASPASRERPFALLDALYASALEVLPASFPREAMAPVHLKSWP